MASEPNSPAAPVRAVDKIRFTLRKDGSLRWLSHHDLLRTFERMLRRAGLPVHHSRGFHPHPRLIFALSLPLGVVGLAEIVEVEFDEFIEPAEALRRVNAQSPPGLTLLDACRVPVGVGASVVGLCYALTVPPERRAGLAERVRAALAAPECLVERTRPPRRTLDIRPYLRDIRLDADSGRLEVDLRLTPAGTARPDEVLALLGLSDLPDAGCVLERARLDLEDDSESSPPADDPDAD
jgi:radical SAM-linked protein